ncbi:MAG: UDP-3-O-acyl-N-acetylglucosamine deacetylase [Acidiphilium sp.]|nr:UDP-3-O-acyl-N-acetylglucosamine deacetylase [Acidiphilium sp.]MDD4935266.1 UDP-3-O-acyl-N-acetylglucosamine deacetylase [Acidiphilium sp.]
MRRGLKSAIGCSGVGLHSGAAVSLWLVPGVPGEGIAVRRVDLPGAPVVAARWDRVADTRMCTVLADPARPEVRVGTVEHVMAALAGLGVDDALIEVDGPEFPILDGSAAEFAFLIECAGIAESDVPRETIEIMRPVRVVDGAGYAELRPAGAGDDGFAMALAIEFAAGAIGRQNFKVDLTQERFISELARARTFTFADEVEALQAAGLARGGSLANAVVVDGARVVNPEGLRFADEFVRHKLLDVVGDLALAGAPIVGRFEGARTGHRINNMLLRAVFADAANYRMAGGMTELAAVA